MNSASVSSVSAVLSSHSQNCEPLPEDEKFALNTDKDILNIRKVHLDDAGFYTCKMTFSLDGVVGEMAESIECLVHGEHYGYYVRLFVYI